MTCRLVQPDIGHSLSRDGVMVFSVRREALAEFVRTRGVWQECYADFTPLVYARSFDAYSWDGDR